jgi:hypothetical protein
MTEERRTDARVPLNLPARYDGLSGAHEARVEDIGLGGCFINTHGQVKIGEIITIGIKMPSGEWLQLRGEVTAHQPGIGFGIVFSFLTDDEERTLQHLITG